MVNVPDARSAVEAKTRRSEENEDGIKDGSG